MKSLVSNLSTVMVNELVWHISYYWIVIRSSLCAHKSKLCKVLYSPCAKTASSVGLRFITCIWILGLIGLNSMSTVKCEARYKGRTMGHPVRIKLTNNGLLIQIVSEKFFFFRFSFLFFFLFFFLYTFE